MKAFIALPALFAAVLAAPEPNWSDWSFTFTFSNEQNTWTSLTVATAPAVNATTTSGAVASSSAWTGPAEWTSTTSYTATYSSGTSTWAIPTAVSYSVAESWTSLIPAPTTPVSSSQVVKPTVAPTSVAPVSSAPVATTPAPSSFTGAAAPNVNGKIAGVGAMAMAGLALVL